MAMQETEGRPEDPPPSELSVGIKPVESRIHKKEVGTTGSSLLCSATSQKVAAANPDEIVAFLTIHRILPAYRPWARLSLRQK
jgi:hypothetical protein